MNARTIETRRGCKVRVLEAGSGAPLVFLHGAGGLFPANPFLEKLAERYRVLAPELPGYGESTGEELLEDMLDFALHGWDVVDALGLEKPHLVGHSMGGMIAAEMACLAPHDLGKLVLAAPAGLWIPEHPIADLFSFLPHEFAQRLFHDRARGEDLLTGGLDLRNMDALIEFYIGNARRLGMAGKILFPIPNRRLSKRIYRLRAPTLLVWGVSDALIPPLYAKRWRELVPQAELAEIGAAGHMVPYEQPDAFVAAITRFVG
ncbi:MAG TPA: alpha/beta fold hydrolase [Myxococcota bacterium]|jgi:pimeloyl-ACP methyl ester carboxylesterase|nr:alpha/beta fold hydrolase [Myxococcota bacterium]